MLFRPDSCTRDEIPFASKYFQVETQRTKLPAGNLVVPRYSVLPYYQELERDLEPIQCKLANSYRQHRWIADFHYYDHLRYFTFPSWVETEFSLCEDKGPFVVKGKTNSRKFNWSQGMYAETRERAVELRRELSQDALIAQQGVVIRKYVPLKRFETGLNGLPFTNEFRFFFWRERLLSKGYYWSDMAEHPERASLSQEGIDLAMAVAEIASKYVNFFVVDVAEKEAGGWIMVELNDGQCSGPSACDLDELYRNLADAVQFGV